MKENMCKNRQEHFEMKITIKGHSAYQVSKHQKATVT